MWGSRQVIIVLLILLGLMLSALSFADTNRLSNPVDVGAKTVPAPPPYCNPCVFYSGDFNPNNRGNGLFDEDFQNSTDGTVWVPFSISTRVRVQGLIINELFVAPPPTTVLANWAIAAGVSAGNPGTVICSGTDTAIATPTGRHFTFGITTYSEYTYVITLLPSDYCSLRNTTNDSDQDYEIETGKGGCPSACYMSVQPEMSTALGPASGNFGYLSDVEDSPANHHFGLKNLVDQSFFNSAFYGLNYVPATQACAMGSPISISQVGCDMFSVGIIGLGR